MDLQHQVAIVTGSTRGIGKATVTAFAQAGAHVVVNGRQSELIQQVVQDIREAGGRALGVQADVTDSRQVGALVEETLAAFGHIDILVNNAGGTVDAPVTEHYLDRIGIFIFCA